MSRPKLVAVGAAHIDRRGQASGTYVAAASNPGTMREEVGGGAFNALRNAVRHGVAGAIVSTRGGDTVARAIAEAGVEDLSAVFLDRTTPSYTALIDADGRLIAGLADMALYDIGFARHIRRRALREAIAAADAVLCDANLPAGVIETLAGLARGWPLFAVAISPAKVVRLAGAAASLSCLFMNLREARALAGLAEDASARDAAIALGKAGLPSGVITDGGRPVTGFDPSGLFTIDPPSPRHVADETGAGDAVAGATVAALMQGRRLREAVRHGLAAAMLTVESPHVVCDHDDDAFARALALVGDVLPVA